MLVDANILLYAVDEASASHEVARGWLEHQLNGSRRVGLPWQSLGAFVRIGTHPRALDRPLSPDEAWTYVEQWLEAPAAWIPGPTEGHADVLGQLIRGYGITADLVPDAQLAAIAVEHGLAVCSADTDFALFREVEWINPIAA